MTRLAVFRALQLGDLLCAIPALRALRAGMPSAEITLIGLPWARVLVERYPRYFDEFLTFPGWPGLPEQPCESSQVVSFLEAAHARAFDLAIQLHGKGGITNPLIALLGATRTAGFFSPDAYVPDPDLFIKYPEQESEVCRLLRLVEHLGLPLRGTALEFPILDADRRAFARLSRELHTEYVCVHPGARDPARRWSPDGFATVADALAERGLQVVLTGTVPDTSSLQAVAAAMHRRSLNLAGLTDLGSLAALLHGARLVVCGDTGVSHLADAVETPSVVVFVASDPRRWAPLDSSRHRAVMVEAVLDPVRSVLTEVDGLMPAVA
jgi:ADP-heptose:LPS heptosyltransferase